MTTEGVEEEVGGKGEKVPFSFVSVFFSGKDPLPQGQGVCHYSAGLLIQPPPYKATCTIKDRGELYRTADEQAGYILKAKPLF